MKKKSILLMGLMLSAALMTACTDDAGSVSGSGDTVILNPAEGGSGSADEGGNLQKDKEDAGAEDGSEEGKEEDMSGDEAAELWTDPKMNMEDAVPGRELMCLTGNEDEAKKIAEQYGISFVEFDNGVAVFTTTEDLNAVIQRGIDNRYHAIEINREIKLTDPVAPDPDAFLQPKN